MGFFDLAMVSLWVANVGVNGSARKGSLVGGMGTLQGQQDIHTFASIVFHLQAVADAAANGRSLGRPGGRCEFKERRIIRRPRDQ